MFSWFKPSLEKDIKRINKALGLTNNQREIAILDVRLKWNDITQKQYDYAIVEYHDGTDREKKLALLDVKKKYNDISDKDYDLERVNHLYVSDIDRRYAILDIRKKYKDISDKDYELERIKLSEMSEDEKNIATLAVKVRYNEISKEEYNKQVAAIRNEPWVAVQDFQLNGNINEVTYTIDWNDAFIEELHENGYSGTPEEMIDLWVKTVFWTVLVESGTINPENHPAFSNVVDLERFKKNDLGDGKFEIT